MSGPQTPTAARQCQPCTACCDGWVQMTINGHPVYPGHPCPHSTGRGCDDYANRPRDPCINFNCGWVVAGSPLPDWMKPEHAKVIVVFNKTTWRDLPVDVFASNTLPGRYEKLGIDYERLRRANGKLIWLGVSGEIGKLRAVQIVLVEHHEMVVQHADTGYTG